MRIEHSEPWETQEGWERRVAEPVHRYLMAPREALAILEAAGQLLALGVSADTVIAAMGRGTVRDSRRRKGAHAMDLREQLAAIEHERWSAWQQWVHRCGTRQPDGSLLIPAALVARWERQIATPYAQLSEQEKNADRAQVERYWQLIEHWRLIEPSLRSARAITEIIDAAMDGSTSAWWDALRDIRELLTGHRQSDAAGHDRIRVEP